MPHMILTVVLIVICSYLFWLISVRRYRADTEGSVVSGDPVPEEKLYVLHKTENGERILFDGDSYFSWEGEFDEAAETWVWDWHGRMGQGLGFLAKEDALFPDGELFTLRGCKDILLAFLPSDGWPVTDMKLFLREAFIFIKRFFSSSSLSAIRVVSSAYLRLLIFLPAILISACASSSPAFLLLYSADKLNKQGNNIQP